MAKRSSLTAFAKVESYPFFELSQRRVGQKLKDLNP
jgi:hypothetical protein